MTIATKA